MKKQALSAVHFRIRLALTLMLCALVLAIQPAPVAHAATRYVATTGTDSGNCTVTACRTITYAIGQSVAGDTINVAAGTYTEAGITVNKNLTISGVGAGSTIVQAHANYDSATNRVFRIEATVTIEKMTIRHGKTTMGGGILVYESSLTLNYSTVTRNVTTGGGYGGGINILYGTLTMNNSTISNNVAADLGGGIALFQYSATLNNSTVSGNTVVNGDGGGIYHSEGVTTLNNSTVSGNRASVNGGGIALGYSGNQSLNHATITDNTADSDNNGSGTGGGLYRVLDTGTTNYKNSIIAGNRRGAVDGSDCSGGAFTSQGYNVLNASCPTGGTGDQTTTDAKLGPLALNGGPVGAGGGPKTHALLATSQALDQIPSSTNGCGTTYTTDERGKTRPVDAGGGAKCDVGAFERQSNELIAQNCSLPQGTQFDFNTLTPGVNVKVTRNSGDPGCVTALKRSVYPGLSQEAGELPIVWTLSASGSTYNLDLALCYSDGELGSVNESTLHAYRWNESAGGWEDKDGTVDTGNNCVTVAGVTALSPWTLVGSGGTPTAITLQAFRARTVDGLVYAGVLLACLLLLGGGLALRQQRLGQRRRS